MNTWHVKIELNVSSYCIYWYYYKYMKVIKLRNTMTDLVYKKYGDVVWMVEIHRKRSDISKYVVSTLCYVITCIFRSYICINTSGRKTNNFIGTVEGWPCMFFINPMVHVALFEHNPMINGHYPNPWKHLFLKSTH